MLDVLVSCVKITFSKLQLAMAVVVVVNQLLFCSGGSEKDQTLEFGSRRISLPKQANASDRSL